MSTDIQPTPDSLDIRIPGGAVITTQLPKGIAFSNEFELAKQLMAQSSAAMAPLKPIFTIIEMLQSLMDVVDALASFPPDAAKIANAVPTLTQKITELVGILPQASVPFMALDMIDMLLQAMRGLIKEVERIEERKSARNEAEAVEQSLRAGGFTEAADAMRNAIDCADNIIEVLEQNLESSSEPINSFVTLLNLFLSLIGLSPIPPLSNLTGDALDTIDGLVADLTIIRDSIPI